MEAREHGKGKENRERQQRTEIQGIRKENGKESKEGKGGG